MGVTTLSFAIVNADYSDLEWVIEYNCDWVKEIKPTTGTLKSGKTETIVVVIDRDKLNSGNNETILVIKTTNGRSEITVKAIGEERVLPSLNTLEATEVKATSAVLNGEIIHKGVPEYTERGFVYSTESMPTIETALSKLTVPVSSTNEYSYKLENLTMDNTYYVRAYAINNYGTAYSTNEINFTTHAILPQVTMESATDVSNGCASLHGTIVDAGDPPYTERGFVYSLSHSPTINDNKIVANGSGTGKFSIYTTSLPKGKKVYIRAYATIKEAGKTAYGDEIEILPEWIELPSIGIAVQAKDLGDADWSTASSMCKNSKLGGYNDWRLPTKEELVILYTNRDAIGGFIKSISGYWSSSFCKKYYNGAKYVNYYYYVDFYYGDLSSYDEGDSKYVRAVRTLTN